MEIPAGAPPALACVLDAIPREERADHLDRLRRLFRDRLLGRERLPDGYAFRFDPGDLVELGRFVANERRCCPFLSFEINVEPAESAVSLRMTGPHGTHAFLEAELSLQGGYDGQIAGGR